MGAPSMRMGLRTYLVGVSTIGLPLLALAAIHIDPTVARRHWLTYLVVSVFLIVGELRPIPVSRGADAGDELSISSTLAVALVLLAPAGVACLAQALALTIDESRSRRSWDRLAFNVGQYTISLLTTRAVFSLLTGKPIFAAPHGFSPQFLAAALLAAGVFFLLNNGLTGIAVALAIRLPVRRLVAADLRAHLPTAGVLLALAPVVAQALAWSVFALPLLMLPLAAVHRSAKLASQREHEALHDSLTGLPNRTKFLLRLEQACSDLGDRPIAVMLLDLDHFKEINDTLGHHVGDLLLVEVAGRLQEAVRDVDVVARLGGDEFAVLAADVDDEVTAEGLARRLRQAFEASFPLLDADLVAACSVGIALAPRDGRTGDQLLKRADVAMYAAKANRGSIEVYDGASDEHSVERLTLVAELRRGLATGDIFPLYQPQCDAATGQVVGVEALARWRHPEFGVLAPSRFIDVAEGAGLLDRITDALLDTSLREVALWHASGRMLSLALNISPRTLLDRQVVNRVEQALARAGVEPRWLTLEVTEHVMVNDAAGSIRAMAALRRLGCRIAIDDFGTGYSSLAYLKKLPVHELKIDRSFVEQLGQDPQDEYIVRATIELAHRFGLTVTAEGVESDNALALLASLSCDLVQGYGLAKPLTADALAAWMDQRDGVAAPDRARARLKAV